MTMRQYLSLKGEVTGRMEAGRVLSLWEENPWFQENVTEALDVAKTMLEVTKVSRPIAAGTYLYIQEKNPELVGEYFDGISGVVGTDELDPRHFTRRALQSSPKLRLADGRRAPGGVQENKEKMFLIKGFNHWASGEHAACSFDDENKPEDMTFSDGTDLEKGAGIPEVVVL